MEKTQGYTIGDFNGRVCHVVYVKYHIDYLGEAPVRRVWELKEERFDEHGCVTEHMAYNRDCTLNDRATFTYHPDGRKAEQCHYDERGRLTTRFVEVYDDNGQLLRTDICDGEGKITGCFERKEHKNSEVADDLPDDMFEFTPYREGQAYRCDAHGNPIEVTSFYSGSGRISDIEEYHIDYYQAATADASTIKNDTASHDETPF